MTVSAFSNQLHFGTSIVSMSLMDREEFTEPKSIILLFAEERGAASALPVAIPSLGIGWFGT